MVVVATNNKLRGSVQKVNLVASLIRESKVLSALINLKFSKKRLAGEIRKILFSAIANAQNNYNLDVDRLYISQILVGKSKSLKRMKPRARGRSNKINKPYCNIKVFLDEVA